MGHLMRCVAIAEVSIQHGWRVAVAGDLDPIGASFVSSQCEDIYIESFSENEVIPRIKDLIDQLKPQTVHIDSYVLDGNRLPRGPWLLSNMQDGCFGARDADLTIDPTFGAEASASSFSQKHHALLGSSYCPIRYQVRKRRRTLVGLSSPPKVLIVLGGTDPLSLSPKIAVELAKTKFPIDITLIATNISVSQTISLLEIIPTITVLPFVEDLPQLVSQHDIVISAAGTSIWDFMCIGVPIGAICVVDNQIDGYRRITNNRLVIGLGEPPYIDLSNTIREFVDYLDRPDDLVSLSLRGQSIVDGMGSERIIQKWEQLI